MSNVSDTNEIVAARLLFPLARIVFMGVHKLPFPSIFTCRMTAPSWVRQSSCTSRPVPLASERVGVVRAPPVGAFCMPEMRSQAAERPETMHIGNNG
jgi:hypothetical protein